jgi:hypothetical protein
VTGAPVLRGLVRRRVLLNVRVDPHVIQRQLPSPFRPLLVGGWAIAGVCVIRLEQLRPRGLPAGLGLSSENAAHRIAVGWTDTSGASRQGVYIPRRDTGSALTALIGGRLFPGQHQRARFVVRETDAVLDLALHTADGAADVRLRAHASDRLPAGSCFASLEAASAFFAAGAVGYSARRTGSAVRRRGSFARRDTAGLDGLELRTAGWQIQPLAVDALHCRYFADPARFPPRSLAFDSAFIMRDLPHEWRPLPDP